MSSDSRVGSRLNGRRLAVAAVVLLSVNLRPGATSVGPVLAELQAALGMNSLTAGVLTALPGICFAMFGAFAVALAIRTGLDHGVALGIAAIIVGLGARALAGDPVTFLACTVLAFAGMAIGNVLVPAFVKRHFPARTASLMAIYTTGLAVGATLGSLLAAPLSATGVDGWRLSLGSWAVAAVVSVIPWLWLARRERRHGAERHRPQGGSMLAVARSPKAVALGIFFGVQSMQAYVQFGWIAQMFRDGGLPQQEAGLVASLIAFLGIPTGLLIPGLIGRLADARPLVIAFGTLLAAGYLGVLLAPTTLPWLWATFLGLSGGAFPAAIALIAARTRQHHVTAQLSGFTQSLGYSLAALGPFAVGLLHDLTHSWTPALVALMATSLVMVGAGLRAAAPGFVDDELPA